MPDQTFLYDTVSVSPGATPNWVDLANIQALDTATGTQDAPMSTVNTPTDKFRPAYKFDGTSLNDLAIGLPPLATITDITLTIVARNVGDEDCRTSQIGFSGAFVVEQVNQIFTAGAGYTTITFSGAPAVWFSVGMTTGQAWIDEQATRLMNIMFHQTDGVGGADMEIDFVKLVISYTIRQWAMSLPKGFRNSLSL